MALLSAMTPTDSQQPPSSPVKPSRRKGIPEGLWTKCEECSEIVYNKTLQENDKVCPKCDYHFTMTAWERIGSLVDEGTFSELDANLVPVDPLKFQGPSSYLEKLKENQLATGLRDAIITGTGQLNKKRIAFAVTDSRFLMGSMGSVVGERLTRLIEYATQHHVPLIVISGSGGGARMYEGMLSLMQMAKTSAALSRHHEAGQVFVSVLTNPTMAGVMASFASLGDIIVAEPRALIGFTGPRVIEQTIRQKLPEGFQTSEFLLEHGLIDKIIHRKQLKSLLNQLLEFTLPPLKVRSKPKTK